MNLIYGLILLGVAVAMLVLGRAPKGKDTAPFLQIWIVGQVYAMVTLVAFVIGGAFVVMNF